MDFGSYLASLGNKMMHSAPLLACHDRCSKVSTRADLPPVPVDGKRNKYRVFRDIRRKRRTLVGERARRSGKKTAEAERRRERFRVRAGSGSSTYTKSFHFSTVRSIISYLSTSPSYILLVTHNLEI